MKNRDYELKKDIERYKELQDKGIYVSVSINKFKNMDEKARKQMLKIMEEFRDESWGKPHEINFILLIF